MAMNRRPSLAVTSGSPRANERPRRNISAKGIAPQTIPGYQDFFQGRFELAYSLLQRHSALASRRAIAATLLVLACLLLLGMELLLVNTLAETRGAFAFYWILRLITLLFLLGVLLCLLISLGFSLGAVLWKMHPSGAALQASAGFFQTEGALFQDEAQFSKLFRETNQEQMLAGVISELYNHGRFRHRQESWLRYALLFFAIALLGFSLTALLVFFL